MDISNLHELPADLLDSLSGGAIASSHPTKWAFLDTETTGLAGGTGTYAFLIGVGNIEPAGFRLRQFFMRDYGEEASLLRRLSEHLAQFDVLITYNGKTYDQPLLETRFRMARAPASLRAAGASGPAVRRAPLVEAAPGKLPAGGIGEPDSGCGTPGRPARRDDSLLLLRISAHAAGVPAGAGLPSQCHRYSVAGVPDGDRAVRLPRAGGDRVPARRRR